MLNLDTTLKLTKEVIEAPNLTEKFSREDLGKLGTWCKDGYTKDEQSRSKWKRRMNAAMDLAMQIQKDKNWPWPNCSNITFPLVTIAVTQFHARAFPAIITGPQIVKYAVNGTDPEGSEFKRAARVGMHMSWQLNDQDRDWISQHDRLLINLAVVGSAFKKSYNTSTIGKNKSELVMAKDLVMDYYAKSVDDCPRKTHLIPMFRNDIYTKVKEGVYRDILEETWYTQLPAITSNAEQAEADKRRGAMPPQSSDELTPFMFGEQHCWIDMDKDGYQEPYIVTFNISTGDVVRIACRFEQEADIARNSDGDVISIRATEYFTKYSFIPSPDGGCYDLGFGILLGPLNESSNAIINQLVDAGTMSVAAGGFLGRGAKLRGGVYTFAPFGWQRVDSSGDDLRKNIFPLPVREPSQVLFTLLELLINYTNRISGSTDIMVGESVGQNTPADTARLMQSEGQKIYNAIFKRVWESMREEFRKLYILNARHMPDAIAFGLDDKTIGRSDYLQDPTRISPVADPNSTSQADRIAQAQFLKQQAMTTPGYNVPEVEKNLLNAIGIPNADMFYDPEKFQPGEDLKITLKKMDLQREEMRLQAQQQEFTAELMAEHELNAAQIQKLQAEVAKIASDISAEGNRAQVEMFKSMIDMMQSKNDVLVQRIQQQTELVRLAHAKQKKDSDRGGVADLVTKPANKKANGVGAGAAT